MDFDTDLSDYLKGRKALEVVIRSVFPEHFLTVGSGSSNNKGTLEMRQRSAAG